jgi:hypothetical protein
MVWSAFSVAGSGLAQCHFLAAGHLDKKVALQVPTTSANTCLAQLPARPGGLHLHLMGHLGPELTWPEQAVAPPGDRVYYATFGTAPMSAQPIPRAHP